MMLMSKRGTDVKPYDDAKGSKIMESIGIRPVLDNLISRPSIAQDVQSKRLVEKFPHRPHEVPERAHKWDLPRTSSQPLEAGKPVPGVGNVGRGISQFLTWTSLQLTHNC